MSNDPFPRDAIFIKWGRFQAGITGRLAISLVAVILAIAALGRTVGFW